MRKFLEDGILQKIIKNSGVILAGNSAASALNLISFTIVASQLGPESLGVLVLCQTYAIIINDLFNIQTWESMIKFGASKMDDERINDIVFTNLILDLGSAVLALSLALLLAWPTATLLGWNDAVAIGDTITTYISVYSVTILFNITTFTIGIPRLFRKFMSVSVISFCLAAIKLVCVLLAVYITSDLFTFILIFMGIEVLRGIALMVLSLHLLKNHSGKGWWRRKLRIDWEQIRFIWWTNLRTIIRIPVRHLDMIIVSLIMSVATLGIYRVYKEFASLISRVGDPVNQAIFPEFSQLIGKEDSKRSIEITKKTMLLLLGIGSAICLSLFLLSDFIVLTFFGVEYMPEITALHILLFFYTVSFVTIPINSLFIAAGFAKYSFLILLFTNSIYLVSAYVLGLWYGIYGLIFAFAVQTVLNKALKVFMMHRHSDNWATQSR